MRILLFMVVNLLATAPTLQAQQTDNSLPKKTLDSLGKTTVRKDSIPFHNPRIATRRSAILPGWGQAYNREYWKIPIAYGIISIPVVTFIFNNNYYKKMKFAYEARYKEAQGDNSDVSKIDPELINLPINSLLNYRNAYRRDRDYSVLFFLLAWGFQVADATVFAHLKQFDVTNNLSMQVKPVLDPVFKHAGFTLSFQLKSSNNRVETR
ncbi:MAG: hypothetical protein EBX50_08890 [Chitinophagia bacterium]|nr:hypothetical protein [Chitinophagia bacterium]